VFAPVKRGPRGDLAFETGKPVDELYRRLRGTCTFYGEGGCGIYAARPYECRHYDCTNEPEANPQHDAIARMWALAEESE
jgi:Fe-S-cluster containining protein